MLSKAEGYGSGLRTPIRSPQVSFRNRLGLFFVLIVIVPMMAVAVLLFGLVSKSERTIGRADIGARQESAQRLFAEHRARGPARSLATSPRRDRVFGDAVVRGDAARAQKRAGQLLASRGIKRIVFVEPTARSIVSAGDRTAIAAGDAARW